MPISNIKKRNGDIVAFDANKINNAISKACLAVGMNITQEALGEILGCIIDQLEAKFVETYPAVEDVQDVVEKELMRHQWFDAAKAYIIYRNEHSKIREEQTEKIVEKIENYELSVIKRDGTRGVFDENKLREVLGYASKNLIGVDIDALVIAIKANMYDGITTADIDKAAVMVAKSMIEKDPVYSFFAARLFLNSQYRELLGKGSFDNFEKNYKNAFIANLKFGVENDRVNPELLNFDLEKLAQKIVPERDHLFQFIGVHTLYDRYFIHVNKRKIELPQTFFMRVAMGLALNETDKEARAIEFYDILSQHYFMSSTPTLFHAGTRSPQLSSCYLTTVKDDLNSIFKSYSDNAQLSKWSGGLGNDWTPIRGTGAWIKATNVESQGVIPFLKIANDVTAAINRSGKRRGATCAYLEVWHYDIEDFIDLRKNTGDERRRTHDMNTASWIPDLFMKRVLSEGNWTLFSADETPDLHDLYGHAFEVRYEEYEKLAAEGKIRLFKTMPANDLWRKMLTSLFETGHPWITFKDPCNVRSPQDHVGVVHSSNLCTEITLNTSEDEIAVCNLGSINLSRHIKDGAFDNDLLASTTKIAMRMLDAVIDINYYPTIEAKNANMRHRAVGLGIMGFQDALFQLDVNFDSDRAVEIADETMEVISYHSILASTELAKEKGVYESFKGSKWDRGILPLDTLNLLEKERGMQIDVTRNAKLDWSVVRNAIKKNGMRNSNCMAVAPTATIANIISVYPSIEPIYKNLYVKSNMSGEFTVINSYLVEDLKKIDMWDDEMLDLIKYYDGSIQHIERIPRNIRDKYKEVFEIDAEWLVKITAYRGKWIDQSQSFNVFVRGTSGRRLHEIYTYAWKMGLKTTYYLRTLGVTQIEKSTLDAKKFGFTQKRVYTANTVAETPKTEVKVETKKELSPLVTEEAKKVKACLLADPECEACQ